MDQKRIQKRWGDLSSQYMARSYTRAKFCDEIEDRVEVVMLRVLQGLSHAREHRLFPAADMAAAQEALLDISEAYEVLKNLGAKLYLQNDNLKAEMEMLERQMEREEGEP
jgi:hypothetical protein